MNWLDTVLPVGFVVALYICGRPVDASLEDTEQEPFLEGVDIPPPLQETTIEDNDSASFNLADYLIDDYRVPKDEDWILL